MNIKPPLLRHFLVHSLRDPHLKFQSILWIFVIRLNAQMEGGIKYHSTPPNRDQNLFDAVALDQKRCNGSPTPQVSPTPRTARRGL